MAIPHIMIQLQVVQILRDLVSLKPGTGTCTRMDELCQCCCETTHRMTMESGNMKIDNAIRRHLDAHQTIMKAIRTIGTSSVTHLRRKTFRLGLPKLQERRILGLLLVPEPETLNPFPLLVLT